MECYQIDPDEIRLPICPVPAPRQTRSDRWKARDCVIRYRDFRDELIWMWGDRQLEIPSRVTFILPMPPSWSKKKRLAHDGQPHLPKPDADNLLKAFLDGLYRDKNDSVVHSIWPRKRWGEVGEIIVQKIIEIPSPCDV